MGQAALAADLDTLREVAAVAFAVGSRPAMSADEAVELADLLRLRNAGATPLESKIRGHARRDPFADSGDAVDLEETEAAMLLEALNELLAQAGWAEAAPAFVHLRNELADHVAT
jgi:hypothetical protein